MATTNTTGGAVTAEVVREVLGSAGYPEATPASGGFSVSEGPIYVAVVVHGRPTPARHLAADVAEALADAGYSTLQDGSVTVLVVKRVPTAKVVTVKPAGAP